MIGVSSGERPPPPPPIRAPSDVRDSAASGGTTETPPPGPAPSIGGETSVPPEEGDLVAARERTNADTSWRPPPPPVLEPPSALQERLRRAASSPDGGASSDTGPDAPAAPDDTDHALREYVVQPGDSLARIAQIVLGRQSAWRRLYEANRDRIPDPDRLTVGQRLRVPGRPGRVPSSSGSDIGSGGAARTTAPSGPDALRSYTVRPGDSLATIARRLLGSEARWREIHELNRDRIPDPDRIRAGTELRIPER